MKISTDNGILRNTFGDLEALRMIRQAGFDGVDMTFYDMVPEQDILARFSSFWRCRIWSGAALRKK